MNKTVEVFLKHLVNELNDRAGGGGGGGSSYSSTTSSYMRYGNSYLQDNKYEQAIKQFQKALDNSYTSDEKKEAYNMLAFSQRKLAGSLLDKSKENYSESLKLDSKYVPALEYYGELLLQMNDLETLENKEILDKIPPKKEEFGELACKIRQFIDKSKKNQEKFKSVENKIKDFSLNNCESLGYIDSDTDDDWK